MKPYKSFRQQALEEFLNGEVERIHKALFKWNKQFYEIVPYKTTLTHHNWSTFIKLPYKNKVYMMREASKAILKKYITV